jgi:carbon-monoxide dehydrogenase medium subunit
VIPAAFEYRAPGTIEEVLDELTRLGDEAKILAGGHSLLPLMKLRLATPATLVDLGAVDGLSYIREDGSVLRIGCMTRHVTIENSPVVARSTPLLGQAAATIGDMQVRNRGTIGGSVCHADPASDFPSVLLALGAEVVVRGPSGQRVIAIGDFFLDVWTTALEPDELVTEIKVPISGPNSRQAYAKFRQRAADWAVVGAAVTLQLVDGGRIDQASIVLANVGSTPVRATAAEDELRGHTPAPDVITRAARRASENLDPSPDLKASANFKRHLATVMTERAIRQAMH